MPNLFGREERQEQGPRRSQQHGRPSPYSSYEEDEQAAAEHREEHDGDRRHEKHKNGRSRPRLPANKAIARAREYVVDLTGQRPEAVTGLDSDADGWRVVLDVVELERVPHSTDVMASYEIRIGESGDLIAYRRLGRFYRNQVERG